MTRNIFIFLGTFVVGAVIALVVRAARFNPHPGDAGPPKGGGDYAAMVSNPLSPANTAQAKPAVNSIAPAAKAPTADSHATHGAVAATPVAGQPVNTVCVICGMAVDPKLPTVEYRGQTIGFGCKLCRPKFEAEPDRYGPLYLKNEVIKR